MTLLPTSSSNGVEATPDTNEVMRISLQYSDTLPAVAKIAFTVMGDATNGTTEEESRLPAEKGGDSTACPGPNGVTKDRLTISSSGGTRVMLRVYCRGAATRHHEHTHKTRRHHHVKRMRDDTQSAHSSAE